jgi:hypothetical protein
MDRKKQQVRYASLRFGMTISSEPDDLGRKINKVTVAMTRGGLVFSI